MSDYITGDDLNVALKEQTDQIIGVIQTFAQQMDERFNKVESRLDSLEQKYDHLITTIDGFIGRIDKYEIELAARDNQFEKLLEWARKVPLKLVYHSKISKTNLAGLNAKETNLQGVVIEDCQLPQGYGYNGIALERSQKLTRELDT